MGRRLVSSRFLEDDIELPLITDVLSLIDLLLTTGEIAVPMLSTEEMEDLRTLLEEAIIHAIESADTGRGAQLDRLTDWVLNAADGGAALTVVSTNYDTVVESLVFEKIDVDPELEILERGRHGLQLARAQLGELHRSRQSTSAVPTGQALQAPRLGQLAEMPAVRLHLHQHGREHRPAGIPRGQDRLQQHMRLWAADRFGRSSLHRRWSGRSRIRIC